MTLQEIIIATLGLVLTTIFTKVGQGFWNYLKAHTTAENFETAKKVVATTVRYVEQVYTDIHGEKKFHAALNSATNALHQRGIEVTQEQLKHLIEDAVHTMNAETKEIVGE